MRVKDLLEAVTAAWKEYETTLERIPAEKLTTAGATTAWSIKDVIIHIAWHENEIVRMIEHRSLADSSSWWALPTDERNTQIYELHKDRPAEDILARAKKTHTKLMEALRTLDNEDLNDPRRFKEMPSDWKPWRIIAQNTYEHVFQHLPGIRRLA